MFKNKKVLLGILSTGIAIIIYAMLQLPSLQVEEAVARMAFIFILAALFWALEILPLYATALLVVVLEIFLLSRPEGVLGMDKGGYKVFLMPFGSPIIFLFFGGFILAKAMNKFHIDRFIAVRLLKVFGQKPFFIMLGFMATTAFLSMWMSNTATTAMMVAMVMPLLMQLDEKDRFRKGLILAIPFAANIGGVGTPVGTPPNAIAIGLLADEGIYINFLDWMKMAVPLEIIILLATAAILYMIYPSKQKVLEFSIDQRSEEGSQKIWATVIALITVILWLTSGLHQIPSAVVAILAASVYLASGLLTRDDLKTIDWDILVLMWGGLALGKGMQISGMTDAIIGLPVFAQEGLVLVIVLCVLAVVLSTFMSNTATSNLLIPIALSIQGESTIMLVATIALSCSFAMALPISTPPNAVAFATNMIRTKDMMASGAIISIIALLLIFFGFQAIIPAIFPH